MKVRMVVAILTCKILFHIGRLFGKGTSLPGKIALRIDPDILSQVILPKHVIAVTGSNGKTSTVEMIAHVLSSNGVKVAYNKEGSNQIEGVTTLILNNCTLGGKVQCDAFVLESDERFSRHTFKKIQPTFFVVTNLYRDQMTRNGHPEWVYNIVAEAIRDKTKLILNGDDPLVSKFGYHRDNAIYFSVMQNQYSKVISDEIYNDGVFCPVCKGRMIYDYHHFSHIGKFACSVCDYRSQDPAYFVSLMDLEEGLIKINHDYAIKLNFKSAYNVYNILAAFASASEIGIPKENIARSLSDYILKNGRVVRFHIGAKKGMFLLSKHENSISYNQSIRYAVAQPGKNTVVIIVDEISRKYFTSETSWMWDIDFELLDCVNIAEVYLVGEYAYDLATRFESTGLPDHKIKVCQSVEESIDSLMQKAVGEIFVITCFSDKDKFLNAVSLDDKNTAK